MPSGDRYKLPRMAYVEVAVDVVLQVDAGGVVHVAAGGIDWRVRAGNAEGVDACVATDGMGKPRARPGAQGCQCAGCALVCMLMYVLLQREAGPAAGARRRVLGKQSALPGAR